MADRTVGSGCTYATIAAASPGDRLLLEGGVTFNEKVVVDQGSGCLALRCTRSAEPWLFHRLSYH